MPIGTFLPALRRAASFSVHSPISCFKNLTRSLLPAHGFGDRNPGLTWEVLLLAEGLHIDMQVVAMGRGELHRQATLTFTSSATTQKLQLLAANHGVLQREVPALQVEVFKGLTPMRDGSASVSACVASLVTTVNGHT